MTAEQGAGWQSLSSLEAVIQARIVEARDRLRAGNSEAAEQIYNQTLAYADCHAGRLSGLAGLVLLELFTLCEEQGRDADAAQLWQRIRKIFMAHLATLFASGP